MLRRVFYILVRILCIVHRLYIICIYETQEKPYIKGREVRRFSGVRMIRKTRVNEYKRNPTRFKHTTLYFERSEGGVKPMFPIFLALWHWFSVMGMAKCRRLAGKPSACGYIIIDSIH